MRTRLTGSLAAVLALAAAAPAVAAGPLISEYTLLGDRMGDDVPFPTVRPRPLAFARSGPAAAFVLRAPTEIIAVRGGVLVIADSLSGRVLRLSPRGRVSVLAGRLADQLNGCRDTAVVANPVENVVRRRGQEDAPAVAGTGRTGFTGDGGPATAARLDDPWCAVTSADGSIVIADEGNHRVRRVAPDGTITTIAGNGDAHFTGEGPATGTGLTPHELLPLPDGRILVTDPVNARVLAITPDGRIEVFAGTGSPGFDGDGGPARDARLMIPSGIARTPDGTVAVTDAGAQTVRAIAADGTITTILGAPPQPSGRPSRALTATVPARRRVWSWITPRAGFASFGETRVSDEAANGRLAEITELGYRGTVTGFTVVRGPRTYGWQSGQGDCWYPDTTAVGLAGDVTQARDLQAAMGARAPYAPGAGPYGPDLRVGRLVLTRTLVSVDRTPQFGVPGWATDLWARRVVEHLVDPRTRRVVAMQSWSPDGYERQYRIHPVPAGERLQLPSVNPHRVYTLRSLLMTTWRCGVPGREYPYGYRDGITLARRVTRALGRAAGVAVDVSGRSGTGRPFHVRAVLAMHEGLAREGVTQITAPGAPQANVDPPGGSYTLVTLADGRGYRRLRGAACWTAVFDLEEGAPGSRVMPLEDAFLGHPVRRGRFIAVPVHVNQTSGTVLVDPRTLLPVLERWRGAGGDHGVMRIRALTTAPATVPAPTPECPATDGSR